ncbi:MAG: DUF427 domain-containing protein [Rhodobacteraceae bacterium]|nr:DUF427 domain-containing protein [Paracoccaceae bacterium]
MALKPVKAQVKLFFGDRLLADTSNAIRLVEVGRSVYDPVLYLPQQDLALALDRLDKSTHCPLKGDASYHALDGEEVAWSYDAPFDFAAQLRGLLAFWPSKVRIEEQPLA